MRRTWRTVRHLAPRQIVHRLRLRALDRMPVSAMSIGPGTWRRSTSPPPLDLIRPGGPEESAARARAVAEGRFEFLQVERRLSLSPFPPPADVPLLWAYHLEYMDYLLDLALAGRVTEIAALADSRLAAGRDHPAARHPYPASRRVAAWVRCLPFVPESLGATLLLGIRRFAGEVVRRQEHDVGGNHLLENGLALALAGCALPVKEGRRFRAAGGRILAAGAREQVLPDGGHYELSPMYHARVLAVLTEGALALADTRDALPDPIWETLARMAGFLSGILTRDGRLPLLGDTARESDLDPRLLLGAVAEVLPVPVPRPPAGDRVWPDSGLLLLCDPRPGHRLLFDFGPTCPDRLPAHGQADTFTFLLEVGGRELVVDAGLAEYAPGPERDYCRSTAAHNTVEIDGANSSEVYGSFRIGRRARITESRILSDGDRLGFVGAHDGYRHLGASHRRSVSHLGEGLFLVADAVRCTRSRSIRSRIHLHPDCKVELLGRDAVRVRRDGATLAFRTFGPVRLSVGDSWHCPSFGSRRRSSCLMLAAEGRRCGFGVVLAADEELPDVRLEGGHIAIRHRERRFTRVVP